MDRTESLRLVNEIRGKLREILTQLDEIVETLEQPSPTPPAKFTAKPVFLSDEWFAYRTQKSNEEFEYPRSFNHSMNFVVTGGPRKRTEFYLKLEGGQILCAPGTRHDARVKMTLPYEVARKIIEEGDQKAGMEAFMQGQIKVEGDMSIFMSYQTLTPKPKRPR